MNENKQLPEIATLFDVLALAMVRLCGHPSVDNEQPLVRIANRQKFDDAPWLFDSSSGVLHVRGCTAIPDASVSALYGIFSIDGVDKGIIKCNRCKNMKPKEKKPEAASDLLFGVIALFEQFGVVLRERGNEFRQTPRGRQLEKGLSTVIDKIDKNKNGGAQVVLDVMGSVEKAIDTLSQATQTPRRSAEKKKEANEKPMATKKRKNSPTSPSQGSKGR